MTTGYIEIDENLKRLLMYNISCPRTYDGGVIYKLTSTKTKKIYVGFTGYDEHIDDILRNYYRAHFSWLEGTRDFMSCYRVLKNGKCKIEMIKDCPGYTKKQLHNEKIETISNMKGEYEIVNKCILTDREKEMKRKYKEWKKQRDEERGIGQTEKLKCVCPSCGCTISYRGLNRHLTTNKCKKRSRENKPLELSTTNDETDSVSSITITSSEQN